MKAMKRAGELRLWAKDLARLCIGVSLLFGALVAPVHAGVTVTYTGPADGTVYNNPPINSITLTATASASQGYTVSKVEFFYGGTNLIGSDLTSPYSFDWTNVPAGSYVVTAVATAVKKSSPNQTATSSAVTLIVNAPPSISLTSPAANAVYGWSPGDPAAIPLSVNVSDSDGFISSVQYFQGGTSLIDTVISFPYSSVFGTATSGNYSITAVVTDNRNGTTTSSAVPVTVTRRPTAFVTSPSDSFSVFPTGANITVTASASDADGTVAQVEFLGIGTDTSAPYSVLWQNASAGEYNLFAIATDNLGVTSEPVGGPIPPRVVVTNTPKVTLTSPAPGATYSAPASVTLTATATPWEQNGTIEKVEFFHGDTNLIATVTSPPYTFNWQNVPAGTYSLKAVATEFPWKQHSVTVDISVNTGPSLYFFHTDHLNTPRAITNTTGQLVWSWANDDPFGANAPNENPSGVGNFTCNLRLPGQYFDKETGLAQNWHRDYSSEIGRYVQSDPVGLAGGINTYAYVNGNPLSNIDLDGRRPYAFQIKYGGGIGHLVLGGAVYTATIRDIESGRECNYQIRCFGVGVGLPEFGITSRAVRFDDGRPCSKCSDFSGLGYIGGASFITGGGANFGGGVQIPNGPFIAGDYISGDYGALKVSVSHNACYFALK